MENNNKKKSFVFHKAFYYILSYIDDTNDKLEFLQAIIAYGLNKIEPKFQKKYLYYLWIDIKRTIDADNEYRECKIKNKKINPNINIGNILTNYQKRKNILDKLEE